MLHAISFPCTAAVFEPPELFIWCSFEVTFGILCPARKNIHLLPCTDTEITEHLSVQTSQDWSINLILHFIYAHDSQQRLTSTAKARHWGEQSIWCVTLSSTLAPAIFLQGHVTACDKVSTTPQRISSQKHTFVQSLGFAQPFNPRPISLVWRLDVLSIYTLIFKIAATMPLELLNSMPWSTSVAPFMIWLEIQHW